MRGGGRLRERMRATLIDAGFGGGLLRGSVLAVDPGSRVSYWAHFDGGDLVATGKVVGGDIDAGLAAHIGPIEGLDAALIETPVGWPVRSRDGGLALLKTAVAVGECLGVMRCNGVVAASVGSTAWRSVLFGRPNPSDREVKIYVENAVDMDANRTIQLNNVHVRDAVGVFLAAKALMREGRLL